MSRCADTGAAALLMLALAVAAGCAPTHSVVLRTAEVGRHHLRFAVPEGWERLDRGRQQLFRNGETRLSLEDLGPATPAGIVRELRDAEQLWRAGQWRVAYARVQQLQSPTLRYASPDQRLDFYREWNNATYVPTAANDATIGPAFASLIDGAAKLPEPSEASLLQYALERAFPMRGMEIERQEKKTIHGADWTVVEVWDRVSHLWRLRLACIERDGNLLALWTEMGRFEAAAPAFDAVLASVELLPPTGDAGHP